MINEDNDNYTNKKAFIKDIKNYIDININTLKKLRAKIYPISLYSSPNIYNEMYEYWNTKGNKLPLDRLENSSNKYLYIKRFIDLANKKYYVENNRLYYIKKLNCERNVDGTLKDKAKCILKKIPYTYEVYKIIINLHNENNHAPKDKIIKLKEKLNYYHNIFLIYILNIIINNF